MLASADTHKLSQAASKPLFKIRDNAYVRPPPARCLAKGCPMARGSLREVETLAEIAHGLGYISTEELAEFRELLDHLGRMLTSLLKRLGA